jgi:lipopolysaccharide/colanic/teichoic acid biosynthesis glycosyltransferase
MSAKRLFDLVLTVPGLLLLAPFLAVVAALVKLTSRGPAIFHQTRVGRDGRTFTMYKFRSMVVDAERRGGQLTRSNDARITWMRKLKLDELPQLWNVVRGDMTLVGPRPEVPRYVEKYSSDQRRVLELTPGVTDPASLRYFDEGDVLAQASDPEATYVREIMPEKIRLNLEYRRRATLWTDLGVVLATLARMFSRKSPVVAVSESH